MPPHDPYIGQDLGPYHINAVLGQGGMSVVYKAWDKGLNRHVAIKLLHHYLSSNAECRERLAREAQTVAKLQHPNIVQIYGYSEINGNQGSAAYLATEFVPGSTLKQFLQKRPLRNAPEIAADICLQIANSLTYAHTKGVIHRDIKPENIMVHEDGLLKLMDFGIAQARDQKSLTLTGALLGSPAHMAPEIIEGKEACEKSDIFSLSTVFYWLLTGKLPFEADNPHVLMQNIVEEKYVPAAQESPAVPLEINILIEAGLKRNPEERPSARELKERLEAFLGESKLAVAKPEISRFLSNPAPELRSFLMKAKPLLFEEAARSLSLKKNRLASYYINRILILEPNNLEALELLGNTHNTTPKRNLLKAVSGILAIISAITIGTVAIHALQPPAIATQTSYVGMSWEIMSPHTEHTPQKNIPARNISKKTIPTIYYKELLISPYADIYVDDELVAQNQKFIKLKLAPGNRKVDFRHQYAKNKTLWIEAAGDNPILSPTHIVLSETKPSKLTFESPLSADVIIDGRFLGSTMDSKTSPFEIPMPDQSYSKMVEVIVSKKGYVPFISKTKLIAGALSRINVTLIPEA